MRKTAPAALIVALREKTFLNGADPRNEDLAYWRERILSTILAGGLALTVLAVIPAVFMSLTEGRWQLLAVDLAAFTLAALLLRWRRLDLRAKSAAVLAIVYAVGVFISLNLGFASGGPAWLFFFAVLSGVLTGLKGALAAAALNAATLAALALYLSAEAPFWQQLNISFQRALTAGINFVVLNTVSAVAVAVLVNGLHALNRRTLQATAELEKERAALRQSETRYRVLAESLPDVIWSMDMNLRFTYVGPRAHSMQGWTREEHLKLGLNEIMTPASIEKVTKAYSVELAKTLERGATGNPTTLELELLHKSGSTVWAEVTATFLFGEDGKPSGILGVTRDITERRKAAREREQMAESLERAKKMESLGTLAGGVAHDLNNLLAGIVSYPDLLLWDLPQASPLRRPLETIRDTGKKAAAIVQDLLTLTRRGVSAHEVLDLNELIQNQIQSPEFKRLLKFHPQVEIKTELDPGLMNVVGSGVHISKTVMNLVSNAAEALPEGGIIRIATENVYLEKPISGYAEVAPGPYTHLSVCDSGVGIPAEDLKRIFEPFYTKKKMGRSGTGLGMTVVWGTVQDHHGYIDIRSTPGAGTMIDLFFPATSRKPVIAEAPTALKTFAGGGEEILIVDDMSEQREILARTLAHLGYATASAASGEEAVAYMAANTAELVILDMIMDPGIDGLETYRRILERHPRQKALIISGYAETKRVKRALELGAGAYIKKPYTVEELAKAVRRVLAPHACAGEPAA
jgi:PAS domain S-box-containing protein